MNIALRELALRQLDDYRRRVPGTWFAENRPPLDLGAAYAVQTEVARLRSLDGDRVAGYKVGCIGPEVRRQFGMSGPIRGFLYQTEMHRSGATLAYSSYAELAIEGEMAVQIGVDGEVASAFPVIELHNYVFRAKAKTLQELIANNGLNAGILLPSVDSPILGLVDARPAALEVTINEAVIDRGPLWSMSGGPDEAVAWLRRHLATHGLALEPGQIVLTGTALGLHPVKPGDRVRVAAGGFGTVEAAVAM